MRIAFCFSGQIRTGCEAAPSIKNYIGNLYDNVDFFMHTWDISQSKVWHPESIAAIKHGLNNPVINDGHRLSERINEIYDKKFVRISVEKFNEWSENFYKEYHCFSPLWYSWQQSILLKKQAEEENNIKYDLVVKIRPDIIFPDNARLSKEVSHVLKDSKKFYAINYTPRRVDDVFFISNSDIMNTASLFFSNTKKRIWDTNLFGEFLNESGISVDNTYNNMYAILREEVSENFDKSRFNYYFNLDRDYHAPYTTDRLEDE